MKKILRHSFLLVGVLFIATSFTNAYYVSSVNIGSNVFSTASAPSDDSIKVNEIYPNPPGSNERDYEWVELYNGSNWPIDVNGWQMVDMSENYVSINSTNAGGSTIIPAHGWIVIHGGTGTTFLLNNDHDAVVLMHNGHVVDGFAYSPGDIEDVSWGRVPDGTGAWTYELTPTPGGPNA